MLAAGGHAMCGELRGYRVHSLTVTKTSPSRGALVIVDYVSDLSSDCCYSSSTIISYIEYKESPYFASAAVLCKLEFCGFGAFFMQEFIDRHSRS